MNTKEVLSRAADIVQERGLNKGDYATRYNSTEGPVCAIGAVRLAAGGSPWRFTELAGKACSVLAGVLPKLYDEDISAWNDKPRRRKHEVVKLLRKAAASL